MDDVDDHDDDDDDSVYMPNCIRMFNSIEGNNDDDDEYLGVYVQLHTIHMFSI